MGSIMESCKYCKIQVYIFDHKCSGCRSRLIHKARPSHVEANKMIAYLQHSTRIDRKTLIEEYKEWIKGHG